MKSLSERIASTPAGKKAWHQERVIFEVTERLCELLKEQKMSRTQFAKNMGTTKGYVSQLLDGEANMTLRTLSDAFLALDRAVHISEGPVTLQFECPQILRMHDPSWVAEEKVDTPVEWRLRDSL